MVPQWGAKTLPDGLECKGCGFRALSNSMLLPGVGMRGEVWRGTLK